MYDNYNNPGNYNNDSNESGQGGIYTGYRSTYGAGTNPMGTEPPKPAKKKSKIAPKIVLGCFLGLAFGLFAGAGFYAVTIASNLIQSKLADIQKPAAQAQQIEETQPAKEESGERVQTTTGETQVVTTDVTKVVDKVMPAVVSIENKFTQRSSFFGQPVESEAQASGSGIIVGESDKELLIVTNYHVIENADTLTVTFTDSEKGEAQVKGYDSEQDVAVIAVPLSDIKTSTKNAIVVATLGDSDKLTVGEPAIAIGNALGYGQSVTVGVISALDRPIGGDTETPVKIQTDAAINPGNSGGALLNIQGEVVGINSNKIGGTVVEGMGYAIPISSVRPIIDELMTKTTRVKVDDANASYLGISGVNITDDVSQMYGMPKGIYVAQVYEDTAAAKAGLVKGDIITKFDGTSVTSMEDLQKTLQFYAAGTTVDITIQQGSPTGYQEKKVTVTLGAKEEAK